MKTKGYLGHVRISPEGRVVESDVSNSEEIAKVIKFNIEKGNEEAKELGFSKLNGFAMIGSDKSLAFMKNLAVLVDNQKVDWQELFVEYVYNKVWIAIGSILVIISVILYYLAIFTPFMNYFAPEPRLYLPTILILVGVIFLGMSRTKFSYRL
ncbi:MULTISPECIES: DUF2173 family protein [Acidianus]|uniref:NUMOD4 domain-containing protein n=1 Tax=Candidatus Acidianus copahuensis TaxID=1160895 RepID=A0A031LTZ8_9CREN|nr:MULTISPECIES: DUF2173 family protein [Acidianus]EZQ10578.1 hypothetical protein CM19_03885 [Candidatus Acidianus copahuensis]NON62815.1 DUF2173 family protein [Acidianus sp. RZ1]